MINQVQSNKVALVEKIQALDFMMESLNKMDASQRDQVQEMVKKISARKLILMDELFQLLGSGHLSVV